RDTLIAGRRRGMDRRGLVRHEGTSGWSAKSCERFRRIRRPPSREFADVIRRGVYRGAFRNRIVQSLEPTARDFLSRVNEISWTYTQCSRGGPSRRPVRNSKNSTTSGRVDEGRPGATSGPDPHPPVAGVVRLERQGRVRLL